MLLYDHPWHRGHVLYTTAGLDSGMCLGASVNFIITMLCLVYFSLRHLPGLHSYKVFHRSQYALSENDSSVILLDRRQRFQDQYAICYAQTLASLTS